MTIADQPKVGPHALLRDESVVHGEQSLSSDGEGSITAPAAVRDLRNPLIFGRARFRRFSAVRPDAERTNRLTRALISRQRPSKIKNPTKLIPYRGDFQRYVLPQLAACFLVDTVNLA